MSNTLDWSNHYSLICSKAYGALNLIRRTVKSNTSNKKNLCTTPVRSHLSYCSQLWRPLHFKNITKLEQVQRRATKYILCDYSSWYKQRLTTLGLLPLMYWLELRDLLFLVKNHKQPQDNFNIRDHVRFVTTSTRLGSNHKLYHNLTRSKKARHF